MKSLTDYATDVYKARNMPGELSDLHIELASVYAQISDQLKDLKIEKAIFWNGKGELSDKAMEMKWLQVDGGKKEVRAKYTLDALEKLIGAIKTASVNNALEIKNQV